MPSKRKTWQEKLEDPKGMPKIMPLQANFPCRRALEKMGAKIGDSVVLAPPSDILAIMSTIPKGKLITSLQICERLAVKHGAIFCCPLTTGIFINIVANAAEETGNDMPYWRTIKNNGELNPKYPGGAEHHKALLEDEGYIILQKGKKHIRYLVKSFERYLLK